MMFESEAHETQPPKSLAQRLSDHAKAVPSTRPPSILRQVIEVHEVFANLRQEGRTSEDLVKLLALEGIHLAPGTLRNYLAQIDRAVAALDARGNHDPSIEDIHRMIIQMTKASRGGAIPEFEIQDQDDWQPGAKPSVTNRDTEKQQQFRDPRYQDTLRRMVTDFVNEHGPILRSHLMFEIARQHGFTRTGSEIRKTLEPILSNLRSTPHGNEGKLYWPDDHDPAERIPFRGMLVNDHPRDFYQVPDPEKLHLMAEILDSGCADPFEEFRRRVDRKKITPKFREELEALRARVTSRGS